MPTLAQLKALVKSHSGDKPKLSAGKEALLIYAEKQGLLKKPEAPVVSEPKVKKADVLPEVLKKSKTVRKEVEPESVTNRKSKKEVMEPDTHKPNRRSAKIEPEPVSKPKSSFSAFMSANKGSGLTMTQLAEKYRAEKM
jgi:hypothetical protein